MNRTRVVLALLLASTITLAPLRWLPSECATETTVYIRADGSIEPQSAPIISVDNTTYTFTGDITGAIVVERDNVVVNGADFTLRGTGTGDGVEFVKRKNASLVNINIEGFFFAVHFSGSSDLGVSKCDLASNEFGLKLEFCRDCTVQENNIASNGFGVVLDSCYNITICESNVTLSKYHGLFFYNSSSCTISKNSITGNFRGIYFDFCSDNRIESNNISSSLYKGARLAFGSGNVVSGNAITNNVYGFWLFSCCNNTLNGNSVSGNSHTGLWLEYSSDSNIVFANEVGGNGVCGLYVNASSSNSFYHNNFIDNAEQVHVETLGYPNLWSNNLEGNYWSDYSGIDSNHDGIGDAQYALDENNTDDFPLLGLFHSFEPLEGQQVWVVSNSTVETFAYKESSQTLELLVSEAVAGQAFGFCRVAFPYVLVNVSAVSVKIDAGVTPVLYANYTLYDNGTHRWIYFAYEHSTHTILIISEFPNQAALLSVVVAMLSVSAAITKRETLSMLGRRKRQGENVNVIVTDRLGNWASTREPS